MKIIRSTRTTSTRGVMLISEREVWVRPLEAVKAITAAPPDHCRGLRALHGVQHLQGKVVPARRKFANRTAQQVIGDNRGNRRRPVLRRS